jgi:hypothetical protein
MQRHSRGPSVSKSAAAVATFRFAAPMRVRVAYSVPQTPRHIAANLNKPAAQAVQASRTAGQRLPEKREMELSHDTHGGILADQSD